MGEAKRRGTYQERSSKAIVKAQKLMEMRNKNLEMIQQMQHAGQKAAIENSKMIHGISEVLRQRSMKHVITDSQHVYIKHDEDLEVPVLEDAVTLDDPVVEVMQQIETIKPVVLEPIDDVPVNS